MRIREHMTPDPITLPASTTLFEAARTMRDADIGNVLVADGDKLVGVATDRDIVVRGLAEGCDPKKASLGEVCTHSVVVLDPDDSVADAERLMREHAIRRIAVVENGRPVGVVSIGDLAVDLDARSALADISAAPANS